MPRPGSRSHDVEQSRLRSRSEDRGIPDERAETEARDAATDSGTVPERSDDRARGPYGERGSGGDPGDVIDLRSPAFSDHAMMPPRLTVEDANVSPPLEWSPAPDGTAELAVVCEDLDGPGGVVTHWVVTGLDPRATSLGEGAEPKEAVWWPNSFGTRGYEGPQPPIGDEPHRYAFRVYALDDHIDCDPTADVEIVLRELEEHSTATGTLIGLFAR